MDVGQIGRRGILASVGATLGLAGCSSLLNGQDTNQSSDADVETSVRQEQSDVPEHDHAGPMSGGATLDAATLTSDEATVESLHATEVTADQLSADGAAIGGDAAYGDRPLVSTERRVLSVPDEFETIQAAIDTVPLVLRHEYVIAVDDGTYPEHLSIPPTIAGHAKPRAEQERSALELYGNSDRPTQVTVDSLTISGCTGAVNPFVSGFTFRRANPFDDEDTPIIAYGSSEVGLSNLAIRRASDRSRPFRAGIKAYGGTAMKVESIDFGNEQCRRGFETKHMSRILHNEGRIEGSLTEHVFFPVAGDIHFNGDNVVATGGHGLNRADDASFSFDRSTGLFHGATGFAGE